MKIYAVRTNYGALSDYIGKDIWVRVASARNSTRTGQFIRILSADNGKLACNMIPGYLVDHPHILSTNALGTVLNDIHNRDIGDFIVVEPLTTLTTDELMSIFDS